MIIFYCNNVWPQYLLGSSQGVQAGLSWGPVPQVLYLSCINYVIYGLLCCGICKTPRPNLRVYLGFCVCSLGFSFCLVLFSIYSQRNFVIFKTFTDVKWRKGSGEEKRKKTCLFLSKSGTSPRRRERFQLAPKITKIYEQKCLFHKYYYKRVLPSRKVSLISHICQKPNLNTISFVTDGLCIAVPDS